MLKFANTKKGTLLYYDQLILLEMLSNSVITFKKGIENIDMYRGNFKIEDETVEKLELNFVRSINNESSIELLFKKNSVDFSLFIEERDGLLHITFNNSFPKDFNRFSIKFKALEREAVFGCGEQFSYFNLRGHSFPLFTGEQGVGRNKNTRITQIADREDRAGGDYYTTFYPQQSFISSRNYFLAAETFAYSEFDFTHEDYHELLFWQIPESIVIGKAENLKDTCGKLSSYLGRQEVLPEWVYDGLIFGVQGGSSLMMKYKEMAKKNNLPLSGIWIQDWEGINITSFGKRLLWNWMWNKDLYESLPSDIEKLKEENINVLGYINPYLAKGKSLCIEAERLDYLAKTKNGDTYYVDFGEFDCAIVDLTDPNAFTWFEGIIERNMIDFGLKGWMADFGEYLPLDCVLKNGDAATCHNQWPGLWAKVNHDICKNHPEILFFMRAGSKDSPKYCRMMWAGDQNVDWSEDDGLPSVIPSYLSLTMSGMGLSHSDIGGYTTLYGMKRSKELLIRWAEMSAFTSIMRSHEGNRPKDNHQIYSDETTMKEIGYLTRVHVALKPYLIKCDEENHEEGIGVIRPLFFYYDDPQYFDVKDEYLLGSDVLVAPVVEEGAIYRRVIIPEDDFIHLFTGKKYRKGEYLIDAPLLSPTVFYKEDSPFKSLFEQIKDIEK
ncbi:MAG: alpha-glucosidase [Sphaerochaeta sp.]